MAHEAPTEATKNPLLSNRLYDILKYLTLIAFPALGALYFGLAQIWGLPSAEEVVGTVVVVDTFLGVILGLSTKSYNNSDAKYDGHIDVEQTDDKTTMTLNLNSHPDDLALKKDVAFKIKTQ